MSPSLIALKFFSLPSYKIYIQIVTCSNCNLQSIKLNSSRVNAAMKGNRGRESETLGSRAGHSVTWVVI